MSIGALRWFGQSWIGYYCACTVVLTVVFSSLNPSASIGLDPQTRLLFWFSHIATALAILTLSQFALTRYLPLTRLPVWAEVAAAGVLGAILFTPAALALEIVFPDLDATPDQAAAALHVAVLEEFLSFLVPLSGTWLIVNAPKLVEAVRAGTDGRSRTGKASENTGQGAPENDTAPQTDVKNGSDFLSAVPEPLGGDLVALTAELHYLRVYTAGGDALILHSFGRALEQLADWPGLQVHRSHWVSLSHVERLERDGERLICVLDTGLRLPVSRPYRPRLRAAIQSP